MKTTAIKGPVICGGLLLITVSLGADCFAQTSEQQQPTGAAFGRQSSPDSEPSVQPDSATAGNLRDSQRGADEFTESRLGLSLLKNIAIDEKAIWTSPA